MSNIHNTTISIARNKHNKYLITKSPKWNGKWVFPGGHIEEGETEVEAAVRELNEETGIVGTKSTFLLSGELIDDPDFYKPAHFKYHAVLIDTMDDEVSADPREVSAWKWASLDELRKMDTIAPTHYRQIFKSLKDLQNA